MNTKVWYKSKTIWASVIAIIITGYMAIDGSTSVEELLALAASTATLLGRVVATARLVFTDTSSTTNTGV